MTTPTTPRTSTRTLSWKEIVQKTEGKDWTKPEVVYEFTGGRTFNSTDAQGGGPYSGDQGDDE